MSGDAARQFHGIATTGSRLVWAGHFLRCNGARWARDFFREQPRCGSLSRDRSRWELQGRVAYLPALPRDGSACLFRSVRATRHLRHQGLFLESWYGDASLSSDSCGSAFSRTLSPDRIDGEGGVLASLRSIPSVRARSSADPRDTSSVSRRSPRMDPKSHARLAG